MDTLLSITGIGPQLAKKLANLINLEGDIFEQLLNHSIYDDLPVASKAFLKYRPIQKVSREFFTDLAKKVLIAGSFRREQPTINDLDILTDNYEKIADLFEKPYAQGEEVIRTYYAFYKPPFKEQKNDNSESEKVYIAVDIFIYKDLAPYLLYATGSKQFNVIMRGIAKKKGYILNQNGLFQGSEKIKTETEEDIFKILGMNYLEPKKRNL